MNWRQVTAASVVVVVGAVVFATEPGGSVGPSPVVGSTPSVPGSGPGRSVTVVPPPSAPFSHPTGTGALCHDLVGQNLNLPLPPNAAHHDPNSIRNVLTNQLHFNEVPCPPSTPARDLRPATVVQLGDSHVGIVRDNRIWDYTMAAPQHHIEPGIHSSGSIGEFQNRTRDIAPQQPWKNVTVRVFVPPPDYRPPWASDPNAPYRGNANPGANEPPGGIKLSGSDYVPGPQPGERPGVTAELPGWANTLTGPGGGSSTGPILLPPYMPGGGWSGTPPWISGGVPPFITTPGWPGGGGISNPWGPWKPPHGSGGGHGSSHSGGSGGHRHDSKGKDAR